MAVPSIPTPPFLHSDADHNADESRDSDGLRLSWSVAENVKRSNIRFVDTAGAVDIRSDVAPKATFKGLKANSLYRVAVNASNDDGTSDFSLDLIIRTRPPRPEPPLLADSDDIARGFNFLQLSWVSVGLEFEYDLRLNKVTELLNQNSGDPVQSLLPDEVYSIEVRARDPITLNSSFWSDSFVVITRPLTPESLLVPMIQPFIPTLVVGWAVEAGAGSFIQLRQKIAEEEAILVSKGNLIGSFTLQGYEFGLVRSFAVRLVVPRNQAPNGHNESFWSDEMAVLATFPLGLFDAIEKHKYQSLGSVYSLARQHSALFKRGHIL